MLTKSLFVFFSYRFVSIYCSSYNDINYMETKYAHSFQASDVSIYNSLDQKGMESFHADSLFQHLRNKNSGMINNTWNKVKIVSMNVLIFYAPKGRHIVIQCMTCRKHWTHLAHMIAHETPDPKVNVRVRFTTGIKGVQYLCPLSNVYMHVWIFFNYSADLSIRWWLCVSFRIYIRVGPGRTMFRVRSITLTCR